MLIAFSSDHIIIKTNQPLIRLHSLFLKSSPQHHQHYTYDEKVPAVQIGPLN